MKKLFFLSLLTLTAIGFSLKNKNIKNHLILKAVDLSQKVKTAFTVPLAPMPEGPSSATVTLPTMEELEEDFMALNNEEIKKLVDDNARFISDNHLIEMANAGKLSATDEKKLIKAIRTHGTLNKILLDRELDEYEHSGKYL